MPPLDYSKIPTADLEAMQSGDISKVSTKTLMYLKEGALNAPASELVKTAPDSTPEWATQQGRFGDYGPTLYGMAGAGKELLRTGIEAAGTTFGAAGGALIPLPGTSLAGAGVGYASGKRVSNILFGEPVDTSLTGIGTDVAVGGVMQGAGKVLGMIPGVKKILSPEIANVGGEIKSEGLEKVARTVAEKTLKVPPSGKIGYHVVDKEKAITTMLEEGVSVTKGGLSRVRGLAEILLDEMDNAVSKNPNAIIKIDSVLGPVNELRKFVENTVNGKKLVKQVDKVIKDFKSQYGDEITVAQAQEIKQSTNAWLRKSYGELKAPVEEAQKQIVRGLKDRIAQEIPEIAGVNLKYGELKNLETVLERAVNRTGNWDWFSLSAGMAGTVVGGATGSVLKATEAVGAWRLLKSPIVQSQFALILHRAGAGAKANLMANAIADSVYNKMIGGYEE